MALGLALIATGAQAQNAEAQAAAQAIDAKTFF